jgi:hypothetical protein
MCLRLNSVLLVVLLGFLMVGCATDGGPNALPEDAWRGLHVYLGDRADLPILIRAIEEELVPRGLNALIVEVDFNFQYESHPELASKSGMNKADAQQLLAVCRRNGIELIPQFQCFGHQGHRPNIFLRTYPELMAPPEPDYADPQHYHVSWNPLDPRVNEIIFPLFDELIEAFEPRYFHVGMDEVMLFPDETTPHYQGETHAEIFAKATNDYHDYLVKHKGLTMLMWGDRLIDQAEIRYHRMESSDNDTAPAIDLIPKDIIICDWHYNRMPDYPSIGYFQEKGFRVWPCTWKSPTAALALMESAQRQAQGGRMLGFMCTTWCGPGDFARAILGESNDDQPSVAKRVAETFLVVSEKW